MSDSRPAQTRSQELLGLHLSSIWGSTDRMFGVLMLVQFAGAVLWALIRSPRTWDGEASSIHPHVMVAIGLGGVIALPTAFLAFRYSGYAVTRWTISAAQLLITAVLIHVSGGRIETHFLVFVSLAFLSFYRDWRLFIPATLVTLTDHIARGLYAPSSIYGVAGGTEWRFVEHAAWVVFEDVVLIVACKRGMSELRVIAERQADLEFAKEAAEVANKTKSQFLASMSHELRTPLNAVIGFAELIKNPVFGELRERQLGFANHIHESGSHLLELINSVLDLAKVESGTVELHCADLQIASALREIVDVARPIATKKSIGLIVDCSDSLPKAFADPSKLRQVLYNLVSNAIKFSEPGTTVVLSAKQVSERFLEVAVTDNGIGILPADQERIFRQFEQVDGSYARKQQGTGLGLALCQSIVELHGGAIRVDSAGENLGSAFCFTLPLSDNADSNLKPVQADSPTHGAPACRPLLVLVVEDNPINMELVSQVLSTAGHRVLQASDAENGIATAISKQPDVILMDIAMPRLDGLTATKTLMKSRETKHIPVIALTAQAMTGDREAAMAAGCVEYITKPFESHILLGTLSRVAVQKVAA